MVLIASVLVLTVKEVVVRVFVKDVMVALVNVETIADVAMDVVKQLNVPNVVRLNESIILAVQDCIDHSFFLHRELCVWSQV